MIDQGVKGNQRTMGVDGSVNSRSNSAKSSSQVVKDPNPTVERENNSRSGGAISVTDSHSLKKKILIDSLKDKHCTVASVLSTLMKSSKEVIDEVKFSELQSSSTVKLSREDILEGETFVADYSQFHSLVLHRARVVEKIMDDVIGVIIIAACDCVQKENKERQQNAILEALGNHDLAIKIGDATNEALEKEDRVKAVTLENIIDSKMSGTARKYFSKATLQMSKLVKRAIDLEQGPIDKVRIR